MPGILSFKTEDPNKRKAPVLSLKYLRQSTVVQGGGCETDTKSKEMPEDRIQMGTRHTASAILSLEINPEPKGSPLIRGGLTRGPT